MILKVAKVNLVPLFALQSKKDISVKASKVLGASYNGKHKVWYYPAYYPFGNQVYKELQQVFGRSIEIDESVTNHLAYLEKCSLLVEKNKVSPKFKFKTKPMAHQYEGLVRAIVCLRLGIFWECGVGKTKLAVDTIRYLKMNTLFLCPSRLVENVVDEIKIHAFEDELEVFAVIGKYSRDKKLKVIKDAIAHDSKEKPGVLIVGYETASSLMKVKEGEERENDVEQYYELIQQFSYNLSLFDESHKLRSIKSNTSNICSKLASRAYRRILLTGTPSLGNPLHLYTQMRILMPWRFPNYFSFKNKFVTTNPKDPRMITGFKNLHLLRRMVDSFSIQKTKEECLDLPARSIIPVHIPMSPEQETLYNQVQSGLHTSVEYNPLAILIQTKLHQICGGTLVDSPIDYEICKSCENMPRCVDYQIAPFSKNCIRKDIERPITNHFLKDNPKLDRLKELLDSLINGEGKKVILWYRYGNEYKIITEAIRKAKIKMVDYGKEGHDAVHTFQNEEEPMVFLAQIQSSSGITLTAATYTIYYSLTFDLEHYLQSRDRMYRKGQDKKTIEYHLVITGSIDEHISKRLQKKEEINHALLRQDLSRGIKTKVNL